MTLKSVQQLFRVNLYVFSKIQKRTSSTNLTVVKGREINAMFLGAAVRASENAEKLFSAWLCILLRSLDLKFRKVTVGAGKISRNNARNRKVHGEII